MGGRFALEGFWVENSMYMRTASNLTQPQLTLSSTFRIEERDRWVFVSTRDRPHFYLGEECGKDVRRWRASYCSYEKLAPVDSLRRGLIVLTIRLIPHTVYWVGS